MLGRHGLHIGLGLVEGGGVTQVAARVGVAVARQAVGNQRFGLLALARDAGQRLALLFVEHLRRVGRVAQQLANQLNHRGQAVALGGDVNAQGLVAGAYAHLGLQAIEGVGNLLARHASTALVDQAAGKGRHAGLAAQAFGAAVAQTQPRRDDVAARALGQQRHLQTTRQHRELRARIDVGWRGLKGLGLRRAGIAFVAVHQCGDVDARGLRRAFGRGGGQVGADGAVVSAQPSGGHALHVGQR